MGNIYTQVKNKLTSRKLYKILLLGPDNSGKTTLL